MKTNYFITNKQVEEEAKVILQHTKPKSSSRTSDFSKTPFIPLLTLRRGNSLTEKDKNAEDVHTRFKTNKYIQSWIQTIKPEISQAEKIYKNHRGER